MPALLLDASRRAILAQLNIPFSPAVLEMLHPEDFLIVHAATDLCTRTKERRINPNTGQCYSISYTDLQLRYQITAEATGNYGLANYHPGLELGTANGVLPFINAIDTFGCTGGTLIYEDPIRTRLSGDLPGITFTVARENATFNPTTIPRVSVATVTTISTVPTIPPTAPSTSTVLYANLYGRSAIWIRALTLTGPISGILYFTNQRLYYSTARSSGAPATLAAFRAQAYAGAEGTGNAFEELMILTNTTGVTPIPGGTRLLNGTGLLPPLLAAGTPLPDINATANLGYSSPADFHYYYTLTGDTTPRHHLIQGNGYPTFLDKAGFLATARLSPSLAIREVYDVHRATWYTT